MFEHRFSMFQTAYAICKDIALTATVLRQRKFARVCVLNQTPLDTTTIARALIRHEIPGAQRKDERKRMREREESA